LLFRYEASAEVFPLLEMIQTCKEHREFADEVMSFFGEKCHDELPSVHSLFFTGGVYLPLTVVDLELVTGLTDNRVTVDLATAIQDAFVIHLRIFYFHPGVKAPALNESTTADPLDRFRKRRQLHTFLKHHAGGLKQFDLMTAATRKVLSLHIASYASLLLRQCPTLQPTVFSLEQQTHYCSAVVMVWVQTPRLRELIERNIPEDLGLAEFIGQSVRSLLPHQLGKASGSQTILRVAVQLVNEWKRRLSIAGANAVASETDQQNCEFFVKVVDELSFALLLGRLSRIRFGLPRLDNEARAEVMEYYVKDVSEPPVEQLTATEDEFINNFLRRYQWVQFLMLRAEEAMRHRFESEEEATGIGELLLYFVELEKWLRPIMHNERYKGKEINQRRLIITLCQREPVYLKWNFLRVRIVMKNLTANEITEMPIRPLIGVLFSPEIKTAFQRLKKWLGFRAKIKCYPPLEGIGLIGP
jgi:hypothetical protein